MSIVMLTNGRRAVVGRLLQWLSTLEIRLFVDPSSLSTIETFAEFTEPSFAGYAPQKLDQWSGNFLNPDDQGEVDEQVHFWRVLTTGASNAIQGYFVTDENGYAIWAELNPAGPVVLRSTGDTYSVLPRLMCGELC